MGINFPSPSLSIKAGIAQLIQWLGYKLSNQGIWVPLPAWARNFSQFWSVQTGFGAYLLFKGQQWFILCMQSGH